MSDATLTTSVLEPVVQPDATSAQHSPDAIISMRNFGRPINGYEAVHALHGGRLTFTRVNTSRSSDHRVPASQR